MAKADKLVESPSGWFFRESQENGDQVDCYSCGDPLNDDLPIVNDSDGFAFHADCLPVEEQVVKINGVPLIYQSEKDGI